jgi:hypothetical protein
MTRDEAIERALTAARHAQGIADTGYALSVEEWAALTGAWCALAELLLPTPIVQREPRLMSQDEADETKRRFQEAQSRPEQHCRCTVGARSGEIIEYAMECPEHGTGDATALIPRVLDRGRRESP